MEWIHKVYNWSQLRRIGGGTCALCGDTAAYDALCPGCHADLPRLGPACERCATPLPHGGICGHCQQKPPLYSALCAFRYETPLSELLIDLKFHRRLALAPHLGALLAEHVIDSSAPRPQVIVPVPLHPQRLRERGYNQALELARPVAHRLAVPLAPELGMRLRPTATQANLDPEKRKRNVRGAFGVNGAAPLSVAIVDDVITTGSTVTEFAKALRRAGAQEIQVWAVARAAH